MRIFFKITVPLLSPTIGLVLIINSISAFKVYTDVYVLWNGTPEQVKQESLKCIEAAGKEGKFILSGGCEVPRDTPIANIKAMMDAGKAYTY